MIKSFSAMVTAILLLLRRTSDGGPHGSHAAVREIDVDKVRWRHGVCQMTVWTPVVWTVTQTHESEK